MKRKSSEFIADKLSQKTGLITLNILLRSMAAVLYDFQRVVYDSDPADTLIDEFMKDANPNYFKLIIEMFFDMVNAQDQEGKFLFLTRLVVPTLREVFEAGNTAAPADDVLENWASTLLRGNHAIEVLTGCVDDCYGQAWTSRTNAPQADIKHPIIRLNENWLNVAEDTFQRYLNRNDMDHPDLFELNAHVIMGLVKFSHGFFHTLTRDILVYEYEQKLALAGGCLSKEENLPFRHTPVTVGTKFINATTLLGDMGNSFEEKLFGNQLRIFMDQEDWIPHRIYFEEGDTVVVEPVAKRAKFSSSNDFPQMVEKDHFFLAKVSFVRLTEQLTFLRNLRNAFADYHAGLIDGIALYNTFVLPLENMIVKDIASQPIAETAKTRTYAKTIGTSLNLEAIPTESIIFYKSSMFPVFDPEGNLKE